MKSRKYIVVLFVVGFFFLITEGTTLLQKGFIEPVAPVIVIPPTQNTNAHLFPRHLRDAMGKTLLIKHFPLRIVSQTLATDEILLALCSTERIVALSALADHPDYSNVVDEAKKVKGRTAGSAEYILSLQPDLIFVASYSREEVVQLLQTTGSPVFRFASFNTLADIEQNIRILGYAIGEEVKAESLITQLQQRIQNALATIPENGIEPVIMLYDQWGYTAGDGTLFDNLAHLVKARNIPAIKGVKGHVKVNSELIIEWQPHFIITGASVDQFENVRRHLLENPAIATSVAEHHIIVIDNRFLTTASQHIVKAIEMLVTELYGNTK